MITISRNQGKKFFALATSIALLSITGCSTYNVANNEKANSSVEAVTVDNTITLAQVTQDVTFLASDELRGRSNFTNDINIAADFIAKRFKDVGLTPAQETENFKQHYTVERIVPNTLTVTINGQTIAKENLSIATTYETLNWQNDKKAVVNTVIIGKNDNMRKALQTLNNQGGNHLVLLHSKHQASFKRYQSYFARGLTKLINKEKHTTGGAIVIALSDINKIAQFSVKAQAKVSKTTLSNVVGILPGKSKADEIVLYSAHYDHLGVKPSPDGNETNSSEIYNGADDDASGVSAVINLANYFAKKANNERTLMFATFSAEEIGGFGSRYFSNQLNPDDITAMINIEMIGKPAIFGEGTVWMTGMERSTLGEQLNQALAPQNLKVYADPYPTQNLFYRSDNATLARLGVPAHSFSSTQLDKDQHYHQVSDDINSLHLPSMLQVIKMLATATTPLADGSITPTRIDINKVKRTGLIY